MKKSIILTILTVFLLFNLIGSSCAVSVFLTSDNVLGSSEDFKMLNEIKYYVEEYSGGSINCIVDSEASSPGEGTRAITSSTDTSVVIASACAGNFLELAKYATGSTKKIIYINSGALDLYKLNFLRRSTDDDWSVRLFASILKPSKFLENAGITIIQPTQKYPSKTENGYLTYSDTEINKYIAKEIINAINNPTNTKSFDSSLITYHKLDPKIMSTLSTRITNTYGEDMKESYGTYTTQQILYLTTSYIYGYPLETPKNYKPPNNPLKYSIFAKNSYTIHEYMEMAGIITDYMKQHNQAPDYITYKGAIISYYDLTYNFARLTQNKRTSADAVLPPNFEFHKYYDNILLNTLPIILIIGIFYIIFRIYKKIKKRR